MLGWWRLAGKMMVDGSGPGVVSMEEQRGIRADGASKGAEWYKLSERASKRQGEKLVEGEGQDDADADDD